MIPRAFPTLKPKDSIRQRQEPRQTRREGEGDRDTEREAHTVEAMLLTQGEAWSWCEYTSGEPSPLCTAVPSASWEQGKACLGVSRVLLHKQVYDKG